MTKKVVVFVIGMETIDFDGIIKMIKSLSEKEFENIINDINGFPMYAVGVHIIHVWIVDCNSEDEIKDVKEYGASSNMFFRLATKDPSFKEFFGELEI